jgi:hypothetical protein
MNFTSGVPGICTSGLFRSPPGPRPLSCTRMFSRKTSVPGGRPAKSTITSARSAKARKMRSRWIGKGRSQVSAPICRKGVPVVSRTRYIRAFDPLSMRKRYLRRCTWKNGCAFPFTTKTSPRNPSWSNGL